jgi:excisionase family DNA binding protein
VDELLTVGDVAQLTRSTPAAIYQWRRRGTGPKGLRVGNKVLFRRQDIEEWLESRAESRRSGLGQEW